MPQELRVYDLSCHSLVDFNGAIQFKLKNKYPYGMNLGRISVFGCKKRQVELIGDIYRSSSQTQANKTRKEITTYRNTI